MGGAGRGGGEVSVVRVTDTDTGDAGENSTLEGRRVGDEE